MQFDLSGAIEQILAGILLLLTEPFKIGDQIRFRWWIEPPRRSDALDTQDKVLLAIKKTLSANGIDLPFETQMVLFHDQTEETNGDRRRQREGWPAGDSGNGEVPRPRGIGATLRELPRALGKERATKGSEGP